MYPSIYPRYLSKRNERPYAQTKAHKYSQQLICNDPTVHHEQMNFGISTERCSFGISIKWNTTWQQQGIKY